MKKITVLFAMVVFAATSCTNSNQTPPVTDSIHPIPVDTVKKDSVPLHDTVIKG